MTIAAAKTIRVELPRIHRAPASDFLGEWVLLQLEFPLDLGWHLMQPMEAYWRCEESDEPSIASIELSRWRAFHLGTFLQAVINLASIASDTRDRPHIIATPFGMEATIQGFVWKADSNGDSYLVLRPDFAAANEHFIELDKHESIKRLRVSDGRV